jgi:hypothetical protein
MQHPTQVFLIFRWPDNVYMWVNKFNFVLKIEYKNIFCMCNSLKNQYLHIIMHDRHYNYNKGYSYLQKCLFTVLIKENYFILQLPLVISCWFTELTKLWQAMYNQHVCWMSHESVGQRKIFPVPPLNMTILYKLQHTKLKCMEPLSWQTETSATAGLRAVLWNSWSEGMMWVVRQHIISVCTCSK